SHTSARADPSHPRMALRVDARPPDASDRLPFGPTSQMLAIALRELEHSTPRAECACIRRLRHNGRPQGAPGRRSSFHAEAHSTWPGGDPCGMSSLLAFAALSAVLVVIPGPAVMLVLKHALTRGRVPALFTAAGVLVADLVWAMASVVGLTALL